MHHFYLGKWLTGLPWLCTQVSEANGK
ncbi:hypothetical protein [Bdellovibrio sp. SKB1291214]